MLNDYQSREVKRFETLGEFFNQNSTIIKSYPPFNDEVDDFITNLKALQGLVKGKQLSGGVGITSDKKTLKREVAEALSNVCLLSRAYALKKKNGDLAAEMNKSMTKILKLKDEDVLGFAEAVQETLTPYFADADYVKYGITDVIMNAIVAKATDFNNMIGEADVENSENTVASENIDKAIEKIQDDNLVQFDLLIEYFDVTNPDFKKGYIINSKVNNIGIHHNGFGGEVTDAATKKAIKYANIALVGTTKSAKSDLYGHYELIRMAPGAYEVEVSAVGYKTKVIVITIKRGRVLDLDVELEAS